MEIDNVFEEYLKSIMEQTITQDRYKCDNNNLYNQALREYSKLL